MRVLSLLTRLVRWYFSRSRREPDRDLVAARERLEALEMRVHELRVRHLTD